MRWALGAAALVWLVQLQGKANAQECPPAPAAVIDISSNRFYTDPKNSVVDPALWEKRNAAMKPLEEFRSTVARFASRAVAGNRNWSVCAGSWLSAWARGGALIGRMNEEQAHFERVWALSALSMAYLMVKGDLTEAERRVIEPWLDKVADEAAKDYPRRKSHGNNHYYWLGLALGASASATGHERHWSLAAEAYRSALVHVRPNGSLTKEVERGRMALHYHAFALHPLVMLAELAARRGEDWYGLEGGAIHRLVTLTRKGFDEPSHIGQFAKAEQKPIDRSQMSWMAFYGRRFPGRAAEQPFVAGDDLWFFMTGGNMSALSKAWIAR